MRIDAILPAGGRLKGALAREVGTEVKALLPLAGSTVLARTLATLRRTDRIERIAVIGPAEVAEEAVFADAVLPEGETGPANILRGIEWARQANGGLPDRLLLVTTDLPFLTPEAVTGFLDACPQDRDFCVPALTRGEVMARFDGGPHLYVPLREGRFCIGTVFLLNPDAVVRSQQLIARVFAARRSQWGMVRLLGPRFVWRFLTRRLTIPDLEAKCEQMLGCTGAAVRGCAPELAFDIDYPRDYAYARAVLEAG